MASLVSPEFEKYIAQQTASNGTVEFDEFIFANIPNLTAENLNEYLAVPENSLIVHRQSVSKAGVINENAVVYSVTMGTEVGDFDFNFVGLINKSTNKLMVAVQTDPIKKIRNQNNIQGNSLTRSVLLEFTGAKALTGVSVSAETWQIDFTVRLAGLDEKIRLTNRDLYGRAVYFDNSFLLEKVAGNNYKINAGEAYIEGVRAKLTDHYDLTLNSLPCAVYVDVVHHNTVTGEYQTELKFITENKVDYKDSAHYQHYVQIIADIDSNGIVTDRRLLSPLLGITPKDLDETSESAKDGKGHSHKLPFASLLKRGLVKLYSGFDSDSEELGATAKAIKLLKTIIDSKFPISGGEMTGNLTLPQVVTTRNLGDGKNILLGNDAYIGDSNIGNALRVVGAGSDREGYVVFGNSNIPLGWDGAKLVYGDKLYLPQLITTRNLGDGENILLGNDAYIGDSNIGNAARIKGTGGDGQGYVVFGNDNTRFGWNGRNLVYGNVPVCVVGNSLQHYGILDAINKNGDSMRGMLRGKSGAITGNNPENAGFVFDADIDTGLVNPSDGVLVITTSGIGRAIITYDKFTILNALTAKSGQIRGNNPDNVGIVFDGDGDTGIANPRDGVLSLVVNGIQIGEIHNQGVYFGLGEYRFALQGDGNLVLSKNNESYFTTNYAIAEFARLQDAALRSEFNHHFNHSGWQRLPSGLIIQWGEASTIAGGGVSTAFFPIPFPTTCLQIVASDISHGCGSIGIAANDKNGLKAWGRDPGDGNYKEYAFRYIAVGI